MSEGIPLARVGTPTTAAHYIPVEPDSTSPDHEDFPRAVSFDSFEDVKNIRPLWKRNLYMLLEQPTSSQAAFLIHIFTTFLIVLSAIVTVLETVPSFHSIPAGAWFGIETSLVALFTVEYIARCISHSASWRTFLRWFGCKIASHPPLNFLTYHLSILWYRGLVGNTAVLRGDCPETGYCMFRQLLVFCRLPYPGLVHIFQIHHLAYLPPLACVQTVQIYQYDTPVSIISHTPIVKANATSARLR